MPVHWSRSLRTIAVGLAAVALAGSGTISTAGEAAEARGRDANPRIEAVDGHDQRVETFSSQRPVAPGMALTSFDMYGPDGFTGDPTWLQGSLLEVDLTGDVSVDRIFPGRVAAREPLTTQADRAGAVAAVNGSYFDINNSGAPWGVAVQGGELLQSPHIDDPRGACPDCSVMISEQGLGSIGEIFFEGTIRLPDGSTVRLDAINKPELQVEGGIVAFTPTWGTWSRNRPTQDTEQKVEVLVVDGAVAEISDVPGEGQLPEKSFALVGRGDGAAALADLAAGDPVEIEYDFRAPDDQQIRAALSGRQMLVVDGVVQGLSASNNTPEPRTAVGFSEDGTQMYLLTVDGRQPAFSEGIGLTELAEMMVELGAHNALNLDGGGSTTIVAREPGGDHVQPENRPSGVEQRPVPDGLGFFVPQGSGRLEGFWVESVIDPDRSSGTAFVPPLRPHRVFPGLTRTLTAAGYDEMYSPADPPGQARPVWRSDDHRVGSADRDGVFTARAPGDVTVTAALGRARGEIDLTVLDELTRIDTMPERITLTDAEATAQFDVIGYDTEGYSAPIEPADVDLDYDTSLIDITATESGRLEVSANRGAGSTMVTVEVDDATTIVPVTIGLEEVVVTDFENADEWEYLGVRAAGTAVSTENGFAGTGLKLDFDFTQNTDTTRGVGAWPPGRFLEIPGQPRELRLWANTSGRGLRARVEVFDATGRLLPALEHGFVDEPGWRQLRYAVPPDVTYPLALRRFYFNELRGGSYEDVMVVDELTAMVPPEVDVPAEDPVVDPIVVPGSTVESKGWRFAVLADAQVDAGDPGSDAVERTRATLREIRDTDAEFAIVNGNFVADGTAENLAFARKILDEELDGEVPYFYVPGDRELDGGTLDDFRAEFGPTPQVIDHRGTRFVLLNTSNFSYRESDWAQLPLVREQLDAAATDDTVTSVVVVQHLPLRDPTSTQLRQLLDRKEAATVEGWLSEFQAETGKAVAFAGAHAGLFHAGRADGVPSVLNGHAGARSDLTGADGGFTGWSLWGVSTAGRPADDAGWIVSELRPHVDDLAVDAPATVDVGSTALVRATVHQDGVAVPVRYPVSADWFGSDNVHVGPADEAEPGHVAAFDPATGELTALDAGTVTLGVTVNATTDETEIELEGRGRAEGGSVG